MTITPELLLQLAKMGANLEVHADGSFTMISNQSQRVSRYERNRRYYEKKKATESSESVLNSTESSEMSESPSPSSSPLPPSLSLPSTPPLPLTPSEPPSSPPPPAEARPTRKRKSEIIETPEFDHGDSEEFRQAMTDWFNYKIQRRERYVGTGWKRILAEQRSYPVHFVAASVDQSIRQTWKGLFTEKITDDEAQRFLKLEKQPEYDHFAENPAFDEVRKLLESSDEEPPAPLEGIDFEKVKQAYYGEPEPTTEESHEPW